MFHYLGFLLSFVAIVTPVLAASWDDQCTHDMAALMKARGIGEGWLRESDLQSFRMSKGIEVLRVYNVYECEHCTNIFPAKVANGTKITQCAGCGKSFDTDVEVHDVTLEGTGERVIHINGLVTDVNGQPIKLQDVVKAPMKCGHCQGIIPEKDSNCPGCGASRASATPKAVKFGDTWVLRLDGSTLQGFTMDKPKRAPTHPDEIAAAKVPPKGRVIPNGPFVTRPEINAPGGRRSWIPQNRRDWAYTGGTAALMTAIAGYFYANSGPSLEEPSEEDAEIVGMEWFEDIVVQKRQGKGWERGGQLYRARGQADNNPDPRAPDGVPAEQLNDPSKFRVTYEGRYVLKIKINGKVKPQEVSREEYLQWRLNDKVKARVKENGALQGIDRTGRSK